jgi:transposase
MANQLKVAKVFSIKALHAQGWSQRRIAKALGINRETVARYLHSASKPAKAPPGSDTSEEGSKPAKAPPGSESGAGPSKPAKAPTGSPAEKEKESSQEE